ncbi:MAG: hypothetical protein AB7V62_11710 [Thermoleophilia bacterium]
MTPQGSKADDWALTGVVFAAVMLVVIGLFQFFGGLAAIANGDFFVVGEEYVYDIDVSAWGWVHLILGVVMIAAGYALFRRQVWGAVVAIALASLSAVVNFLFIPYYPFWSIVVIALDVFVIWAITRPGALDA